MISVLGRELDDAVKRLQELGFMVELHEARSKKGVPNGKPYVVRQKQTDFDLPAGQALDVAPGDITIIGRLR